MAVDAVDGVATVLLSSLPVLNCGNAGALRLGALDAFDDVFLVLLGAEGNV